MKHKLMPDLQYLKSILDYNPDTGVFVWKKAPRNGFVGDIAGGLLKNGALQIRIDKIYFYAHRLAYYFVVGKDPENMLIDHHNRNKSDNRWINLRICDDVHNQGNTKIRIDTSTGFKGVSCRKNGKYQSSIQYKKKRIYLGNYNTAFYAALVYARAAKKLFGKFYRLR